MENNIGIYNSTVRKNIFLCIWKNDLQKLDIIKKIKYVKIQNFHFNIKLGVVGESRFLKVKFDNFQYSALFTRYKTVLSF